ncbi:hypothetical protein E2C01_063310 [Portunus trituberculatus]|uniref:Uncharacterized protein n=1 Tax=Portunus trituberculatus TaxID=210409 RepID=A0A5B7HHT1_PORTR|nr:hypothetical protein [Portunus trituberculatus]
MNAHCNFAQMSRHESGSFYSRKKSRCFQAGLGVGGSEYLSSCAVPCRAVPCRFVVSFPGEQARTACHWGAFVLRLQYSPNPTRLQGMR